MFEVLSVVLLLGSGITLGVFFAIAVSVAPTLLAMSPDRYLEAHRELGKGYHPVMPIMTNVTMFSGIGLAFVVSDPVVRWLYVIGAVVMLGVQAVSHLGNVPINRSLAAAAAPSTGSWSDPRPEWRFWHLTRTALAAAAFLGNSVAVTLAN